MKRFLPLLAVAVLAWVAPVRAEKETVLTEDDTWNLYSKPVVSYSEIGDDEGLWGGLEIGGILNEKLALGVRVTVLGEEVAANFDGYEDPDSFDIAYGGLAAEYAFASDRLVHLSLGLLVGVGQMRLDRDSGGDDNLDMFVVEPALNAMLNLSAATELGLGLSYRYADPDGLNSSDLSSAVASLFVRFKEF